MKPFFVILFLIALITACQFSKEDDKLDSKVSNGKMKDVIKFHNKSIKFLDSLNYINYYNDSKWKMYLKYCDAIIQKDGFKKKLRENRFFGEAQIFLFDVELKDDSLLNFLMTPVLDDSISVSNSFQFKNVDIGNQYYNWHYYDIKHHLFYGYGFDLGVELDSMKINNYCNDIPSCDKKGFIETNRKILNEWFIKEAIRRKFISP